MALRLRHEPVRVYGPLGPPLQRVFRIPYLTGFVPDDVLVRLYNVVRIFPYQLLYEDFGFSVVEAMACGVPVIASLAGSIPEIADDAVLLVRPDDIEGPGRAIVTLAADEHLQRTLVRRGIARAGASSWTQTALATMRVYDGYDR